ncbi:MAG: hypothetical protein JW834_03705 [Candidatus Diapherotrites archaeon]|nr:hypothetical protein [Candidatus Diapherotrites archaeon]
MEIEVEILVNDFSGIREKLGKPTEKSLFRDVYFGKGLLTDNRRLRIRHRQVTFPENREETVITFKSPRIKKGVQKAEEAEAFARDFDEVLRIFTAVWGDPVVDAEIRAERYEHGNCIVELREILGEHAYKYVEIEGTEKQINDIRERLHLEGIALEKGALAYQCEKTGLHIEV